MVRPQGMAWKMLFSVRMKRPNRIGIEARGDQVHSFRRPYRALRAAWPLEQPVRGDADRGDRMPRGSRGGGQSAGPGDDTEILPDSSRRKPVAWTLVATDAPRRAAVRATAETA